MSKQIIHTANAPQPIGPYSQAVQVGNQLFVSGQIALHPQTGELEQETITVEAKRVMQNLQAVLNAAGYDFEHIVKTTIFLTDMAYFNEVNAVYATYFSHNFPARETVAVKQLPRNVHVEISVIAIK